ncbi:MAG: cobalt-precorrin-5B (C(1))-methyltransferase [Pseudomonadota bacterium]|nr:cobalt-precorrin-5B (C(1))-methyltransferase [Pseudomonadota bacterium]
MERARLDRDRPPDRPQRTGFTTGANACAAACAATRLLVYGHLDGWTGPLPGLTADRYDTVVGAISVTLPNGDGVRFAVRTARLDAAHPEGPRAYASVIKDGGDDPDCTHRAELWAEVTLTDTPGVTLLRGAGVGVVTRPGLGIVVGDPSITTPPRENIQAEVATLLPPGRGARITLGIVDGERLALKTLNARLGIVGGLSILGTTGIVHPYSTAAFRASVVQAIDVAVAGGLDEVVVTTGGRSERFAQTLRRDLPDMAFVQMGDFVGYALEHAARHGLRAATVCGMIGKIAKMADGRMMTHAAGSEVDPALLADIARAAGADDALVATIATANTGRHVQELVQAAGLPGFFDALCERAAVMLGAHLAGRHPTVPTLAVWLTDFDGALLGSFPSIATVPVHGEAPHV